MTKLCTRKDVKETRRKLRHNMPKSETILWKKIKSKNILGFRFLRQYSVGKFVLDFYCPKVKLGIELDGDSHFVTNENIKKDLIRQDFIVSNGICIIRFTNSEISTNLYGVIQAIENKLEELNPPAPLESRGEKRL